eukprot:TRINITY_DN715_c0_g3_i1.p1 TRINITY_DN715_c0_g3~~TRINITY_DN715_c0_g3_i1.p1  ORF type:complete len:445 (+),score=63.07 TRINITY_DN715_c0_g3_i1:137-1471(+)
MLSVVPSRMASPTQPPIMPSTTRRQRPDRTDIGKKELSRYFHLSLQEAADVFGVCPTTMKKICRNCGIQRWPHRKHQALKRQIARLKEDGEAIMYDTSGGDNTATPSSSSSSSSISCTTGDTMNTDHVGSLDSHATILPPTPATILPPTPAVTALIVNVVAGGAPTHDRLDLDTPPYELDRSGAPRQSLLLSTGRPPGGPSTPPHSIVAVAVAGVGLTRSSDDGFSQHLPTQSQQTTNDANLPSTLQNGRSPIRAGPHGVMFIQDPLSSSPFHQFLPQTPSLPGGDHSAWTSSSGAQQKQQQQEYLWWLHQHDTWRVLVEQRQEDQQEQMKLSPFDVVMNQEKQHVEQEQQHQQQLQQLLRKQWEQQQQLCQDQIVEQRQRLQPLQEQCAQMPQMSTIPTAGATQPQPLPSQRRQVDNDRTAWCHKPLHDSSGVLSNRRDAADG